MNPTEKNSTEMNPAEIASLLVRFGHGEVAYVKAIRSDDVAKVFPEAPPMPAGLALFALIAADGSPILLTDNAAEARGAAFEQDLGLVNLN